jgi:hypothetical protein
MIVSSPALAQIPPENGGGEPSAAPSENTEQEPGMEQDNPEQSETSPDDPSQTNQSGQQYGNDPGDSDQMNSDSGDAQPTPDEARPEREPGVRE